MKFKLGDIVKENHKSDSMLKGSIGIIIIKYDIDFYYVKWLNNTIQQDGGYISSNLELF